MPASLAKQNVLFVQVIALDVPKWLNVLNYVSTVQASAICVQPFVQTAPRTPIRRHNYVPTSAKPAPRSAKSMMISK